MSQSSFDAAPLAHLRRICAAALALLLAWGISCALGLAQTAPAEAAARVSIFGTPSADGTSSLTLSGSGFQSVQNGFGGIYVLFGVVDGTWQPSKGGKTGQNLRYAYDDESKPEGFQLFVTFPGSSTAHAANGGELGADGTWSGTIKVPGAQFTSYDRERNPVDVDCTKEQCGIITIGAHGVANATNETFTPVEFPAAGQAAAAGTGEGTDGQPAAEGEEAPAATAPRPAPSAAQPAGPVAQPVIQPVIGSEQVDQLASNSSRLLLVLLTGTVVAISVIALAVGIGAYMATKSLLLGVNPEALERVRARRAKRAISAEHRRRRRVFDHRAKQEARTRRREQLAEAKAARVGLDSAPLVQPAPADAGGAAEPAGPMRFFEIIGSAERDDAAAGAQPSRSADSTAASAPTVVLDRTDHAHSREEGTS